MATTVGARTAAKGAVVAANRATVSRRASAAPRTQARRQRLVAAAAAVSEAAVFAELGFGDEEFTYEQFDAMLESSDFGGSASVGARVSGSVVSIDGQRGAYVDMGGKAAAFLPSVEVGITKPPRLEEVLSVGEEREFVVIKDDSRSPDGAVTLSLRKILVEEAWNSLRQLQAEDATMEVVVQSSNRGGLVVDVSGVQGFIPSSHVVGLPSSREDMEGKTVAVKILEVDEDRERLVCSQRRATAENEVEDYNVGDVVVGTVQAVKPYGAFVSIGSLSGLLHISQISHERITAVENVLAPGDELKVMILSHDRERGRLSLSTKKLEPTPGDMLRNPALVFEKADEMAATFRERVAAAEAAAKKEEEQLEATFNAMN